MLMANNKLKSFVASGAIAPRRFVKFGASDSLVVQAGATDGGAVVGVANELGGVDTQRVECFVADFCDVEYGGTIARGANVTSDAQGRAVTAGAGAAYCGVAMVSGVVGDIASIRITRGVAP